MEKLIELLNEYEKEKTNTNIKYWNYYQNWFHFLENWQTYSELLMISKSYWFIQWLYDKWFAYWEDAWLLEDMYVDEYSNRKSTVVEATIMKLSIEDEPIKFLISILK